MISSGENGSKIEKVFDKIEKMFEQVSERQDTQRDRIKDIESKAATVDALRKLQDEMRDYVDVRNKNQNDELVRLIGTHNSGTKSDVMSEVRDLIRSSLDDWANEKLEPAVNAFLEAKKAAEDKAKKDAEKQAELEKQMKLRTRQLQLAIAAGVIAILYALFDPFTQKQTPEGPLEYQRHLILPNN